MSQDSQVGIPYEGCGSDCCWAWYVELKDGKFYGFTTKEYAQEAADKDAR